METRILKSAELRAAGPRQIAGLAAPYGIRANIKTKDGSKFQETIARGSFDRILRTKPDVVCLFNHDENRVLGRTSAGTLRLSADSRGLNFECDLPDSQFARELHQSIERRDIAGNSFGFLLGDGDDEWSEDYDEERSRVILRTIRNFSKLVDVSPVTHPAYEGTELAARCNQVSAEVRSKLLRRGVEIPTRVRPSDNVLLADVIREVTFWENKLNEPKRIKARRRNLLDQV